MTPFRGTAALEAVQLQLASTLFTGKKKTRERHIHMKMGTVQTRLTYFLSTSGRINLHDDSFQK